MMALLAACSSGNNTNPNVLFVDVDVNQQSPLSEFISAERHICLETNDSCIFSAGGYYGFTGDTIVMEYNSDIYLFSPSGKYISSFNHRGQGPGEYTAVYDLRVYDREIYVMDNQTKKIFKYSLDGELLHEINLDYKYVGFDVKSKDRIVMASGYTNGSMSQFVTINSNSGEVLAKVCPYDLPQSIQFWDFIPFSGRKNDEIYANIPFSHCTYRVDEFNIDSIASYQFNTKLQLPEFDLKNMNIDIVGTETRNSEVVRNLGFFYPSENYDYQTFLLFGQYGYSNHLLKFDKQGKPLAQRMLEGFDDDFPYIDDIRGIVDGEIICIRSADALLRVDEMLGKTYWKDQGLTEDDNPVILFYKLKES